MVGLVIVSHSKQIADGIMELLQPLTQGKVPLAAAGGTADGRLGTDALRIRDAIEQVASGDGVLVLVDLGSAVLNTEAALELLEPSVRERVVLCGAPLVEGAVAAGVEASLGRDLQSVRAAAEGAAGAPKF